jgi:methylated-DNA-[protein]-cysteine S-methyltransferase
MSGVLHYRSVASPLGELYLAESDAGLCRVAWDLSEAQFTEDLWWAWCGRPSEREERSASGVLGEAARQLSEYFEKRRRAFDLPLDLSRLSRFRQRVLTALLQVPYGEVASYGEVAALAGHPSAARAVGLATRRNPLPILIPCHRVVLSTGGLGGFGGRPDLKRYLLEMEGRSEVSASPAPRRKKLFT